MLSLHKIPVLTDNYIFILVQLKTQEALVVDPTLAPPVEQYLSENQLYLKGILNTHHHYDHVDGNLKLQKKYNCPVYGFYGDKSRIPGLTHSLKDKDTLSLCGFEFEIGHIPGHTSGHIFYFEKNLHWLFSGDTVFSLGCGRLFEGNASEMLKSFQKISTLPPRTKIYFSHEYTLNNFQFSREVHPEHVLWSRLQKDLEYKLSTQSSTCPTTLSEELKYNLFFNVHRPELKSALEDISLKDEECFARLRTLKDKF